MPSHAHTHLHHRKQDRPRRNSPLPGGFFRLLRGRTVGHPELRLAAAVLEDAIHSFQRTRGASEFHRRQLYWEVELWFASRNSTPVFSFESICSTLGLSADEIRKLLMLWARRRPGSPIRWILELPTRRGQSNPRLRLISVVTFANRPQSGITGNPGAASSRSGAPAGQTGLATTRRQLA